ncbi:discoidin domain-containing protein [Actinacidiphila acididurans]|uniref:beta-glucosidase n=1 Tax=Actinacidiphila acididurans TaxID=2784346 RepID=A0ABS2TWR4_9ACTN|nr:discoidin domain-containing protein [Actinacidiphila acididurans]MBM9506921.1 discoidin domain-containing protein [Actinacidiphila acididurans]
MSLLSRVLQAARRRRPLVAAALCLSLATAGAVATTAGTAHAASTLLSQGKTATASSIEGAGTPASAAVDGDTTTRWSSTAADPQWLQVDLGASAQISSVTLNWETAYGKAFKIQTSDDATTWTDIYSTTTGTGGVQQLTVNGSGRYVRMYGTARGTGYGYSLWEFQVYGTSSAVGSCGTTNSALNRPATASSTENAGTPASAAVDGNTGTRWSSAAADPQWLQVDLGAAASVCQVVLNWETAYATGFRIQVSNDAQTWTDVYSTTTGTGGTQTLAVNGSGRYVRMYGTARATGYGYSLWEFAVYTTTGGGGTTPPPTGGGGDFSGTVISAFKPVKASSYEGGNAPAAALDGRTTTRWSSQYTDNEWLQVDLGGAASISGVVLNWESAYGSGYRIEVSDNATSWTPIYTTTTGKGGIEKLPVTGKGRYVRFYGTARATGYGYSLWEFQVWGTVDTSTATPPLLSGPTKAPATTGQFTLAAPANKAMVTTTRRPPLSWSAVAGTAHYEVWLNLSRTDYDWTASGNLLDLYTKVAEVTGTGYTPSWDITDRWTYKWFVVAVSGSGARTTSEIRQFSVYLPDVEQVDDGVNVINGARDLNKDGTIEPYEDWRQPVDTRVNDLLGRMTPDEKAYQMFYNVQQYPMSGWHFGPAQPADLNNVLLSTAATRLGIPPVSAGDTTAGYQTTYPLQSTLAAGKDYPLDYQLGNMQRQEELEVGARGTLSPLAEVGTKVLYPRIQEGGGENADVAAAQLRALVAGLQGGPELNPGSVLATVKHWPGEGAGGEAGIVYDGVTIKYHMIPFRAAMEAGAVNIMPGYAGSSYLDPGGPGAGDSAKILTYLRQNMGYTGLITTDWLPSGAWVNAANAGSDVMGGADPGATGFTMAGFEQQVPLARINDAVSRILKLKFELGIFDHPYGDPVNGPYRFHQPGYVQLANQAARESDTLLKNNGVLPVKLNAGDNIVVAGPRATDGASCCIWSSYFHPDYGSLDMLDAIKARAATAGVNVYQDTGPSPKLAIVNVGEPSYTHATSWPDTQPYLPADQLAIIQNFKNQGIPVVVVLTLPRPIVMSDWNTLADAIVVTYRGGEEVGPATASLLFGDYTPHGHLPWQMPRSLDQVLKPGGGDTPADANEAWDLPYDLGATDAERADIRAKIDAGQTVPPTYGNPLYQYGAGMTSWN